MRRLIATILLLATTAFSLGSCSGLGSENLGTGWAYYAVHRDVTGRDVSYVEMCVKDYGKVVILLDATSAPKTVANFLSLVNDGFYDGLTFHRIITGFMIQGGDPKADGSGGSKQTVEGEFSSNGYIGNDIKHYTGTISMARSNDMNSASSQFFICNADARSSLDGNYAAFGYVIMGMSVIDEITEDVFPKTEYAEYYGTSYHQIWQYYGNGAVSKKSDQPVIKYIKQLDEAPSFDYE